MAREIFTEEHEAFRDMVRSFIAKEITPFHEQWEKDGIVTRDVWLAAGRQGLLGIDIDEQYGGGGNDDYRYYIVFNEELAKAGVHGPAFAVHNDINGGYLRQLCNEEQKQRWLPGYCSGEIITGIAMTEPAAGSDLQGIKTTAMKDGDDYVLNGSKTFISNGILADLVIVVAKTDPSAGAKGVSLLVVERGMPGFDRGRNLDKVGMHAQDTAELFFDNVRVPRANLLGEEGMGFIYLMQNLARERLSIGTTALAAAESAFEQTLEYCKTREAFGRPIGKFQHNRFTLAEMKTELSVARAFTEQCIVKESTADLSVEEAARLKYWNTEMLKTVVDRCVQLH
ncbi:MAG: acyl-CoA dehydrogenase domain protein, partial [Actinomycetia bacterium]|nr:acyl-CoA dehydrogenase domain protein [Actinomycetes bacterium]